MINGVRRIYKISDKQNYEIGQSLNKQIIDETMKITYSKASDYVFLVVIIIKTERIKILV